MRLKDVAHINRFALPESTDPGYEFRYVDVSAVNELGDITIPREPVRFESAPSRARRYAPNGGTIVSTVRTYLRAIAKIPHTDEPLIFSTGFAVLEAKELADDRFLSYVCRSDPFVSEVVARSVGVSYPAINPGDLGDVDVLLPPLDEQRRIADFLDAETSHISALISIMAKQDELLAHKRLRLLDRVSVDSADAARLRLGYMCELITSGSRGWGGYVSEKGAVFFRSANLYSERVEPKLDDLAFVDLPQSAAQEANRSRIGPTDVLVGITGANAGWVALSNQVTTGGYVSQHVGLIRPDKSRIDSEWLAYLLASPSVQSRLMGNQYGGTKTQLSLPDLRDLPVPVISIEEQAALAKSAQADLAAVDSQRDLRQKQLKLLSERRQALITAAVTGQIDVTTARRFTPSESVSV